MKPTSKWNRKGTRCTVKWLECSNCEDGWRAGDICTIHEDGSNTPWVIREKDGERMVLHISKLKRIKPPKAEDALKVGDWVEVTADIGWSGFRREMHKHIGKRGAVVEIGKTANRVRVIVDGDSWWYRANTLVHQPAPDVPAGCPVDAQCHAEMIAAGWNFSLVDPCYTCTHADLHFDGSFYAGETRRNSETAAHIVAGWNILAAWRERSKS